MINFSSSRKIVLIFISILLFSFTIPLFGQVSENATRRVRIGSLQSHFSSYGSERAWNNSWYEGLQWPADYPFQDNSVIKRAWIAAVDFRDEKSQHFDFWATYITKGNVNRTLFPVELKQVAKFELPAIIVDGDNLSAPFTADIDELNPNQIPDRIITNVVNTPLGITMTRKISVFSQQYHDNYFIKEYIFKNTGNVDYDDDIELSAAVKGVRVGWGTRYSVSREGAFTVDNQQSWGKHSWVTKRGEDYASHMRAGDPIIENPITDWLRAGFSWFGQSENVTTFDNIGAPDVRRNGRLTAPHFAGTSIIHVDKSGTDKEDDLSQPALLGWQAGDTYPDAGSGTVDEVPKMSKVYDFLSFPTPGEGDTTRMDEVFLNSITHRFDPYTAHNDEGGTNVFITYGPFDIEFGDSIVIVEAEGVSGLSRTNAEIIGARWKRAFDDPTDTGPFDLPDGSTTNDKDFFKNSWIYTGIDSIMLTFGRAKRNYDSGFNIPQPPFPPAFFSVTSGGDRISLEWAPSESETNGEPGFLGYKIFRAVGKSDTTFKEIYRADPGESSYEDLSPVRGFSYYYYIVAYNDGSNNTGAMNPAGSLHSGRFYTRTTKAATLKREAGRSLSDIRIVPNPYNIKATQFSFEGNKDRIFFYNIPAFCRIKIFTERGDLIETLEHTDGSGDEPWDSITSSRQVVVSGLYIAHIEVTEDYADPITGEILYRKGESIIKKFVIIR